MKPTGCGKPELNHKTLNRKINELTIGYCKDCLLKEKPDECADAIRQMELEKLYASRISRPLLPEMPFNRKEAKRDEGAPVNLIFDTNFIEKIGATA